jgi:HAD superfamily hydrolase (TIGR01509 family)
MIRAVLFDFNGVIVDDEPVHFQLFQKVLREESLELSREDYYAKYLGMDDHDCFKAAAARQKKNLSEAKIGELIDRKTAYYQKQMKSNPPWVPGVVAFLRELCDTYYLAVVSGALRVEIESLLSQGGIREYFSVIVAAEEVEQGKPHPEGYQTALERLNRDYVAASDRLLPEECLVVEDSVWGIEAAKQAGMKCLAITTSYPEAQLPGAVRYLKDYQGIDAKQLIHELA